MAVTYPLEFADFFDIIDGWTTAFDLLHYQSFTGLGDGSVLVTQTATPKWSAEVTMGRRKNRAAVSLQALVAKLRGGVGTFKAYDPRRAYPLTDPTGSILGAATVQINSVGVNGKSFSLKGLPAAYALSVGDYVSFSYASGKRALHQMVEAATANGSGVTPEFEVVPPLRPGAAVNDAVTLVKPFAIFRLVPGSIIPPTGSTASAAGGGFKMIQVPSA